MDLEFCKLFQVSLTNRTDVRSYVISKVSQQLLVEAGEGEEEGCGGKGLKSLTRELTRRCTTVRNSDDQAIPLRWARTPINI